jgi:hypothetical protein
MRSFIICTPCISHRELCVGCGGMDWIDLAHDRHQWRALVVTVMNLRVP